MPTSSKNYSTSINDIASGAYANIADSIIHAKNNIITLDKLCNWYLFENEVLLPIPYLNKYKDTLLNNSIWVDISPVFFLKPEYVSYNLYGTTDLWYLMLFLNDMKSVEEFNKSRIRVLNPNKMTVLKNIINSETDRYNRDNPKPVSKHYIKNPNLPSDQLLPDDDLYEIMSPGINNIKEIPIDNLWFETSIMDYYYKGKSKMELYKVIEKTYIDTREYHYMDGIRISNSNSHAVYEKKHSGYERKLSGWINMAKVAGKKPKSLIDDGVYKGYEFIVNGINGYAYVTINNQTLIDKDGNTEITFSGTEKQYDYFERESRNSDFKQRNTVGWKVNSSKQRVATDKEVMKPVFIIDDLAGIEGDVIYGELDSKQLNVATEPYSDNSDGDLFIVYNIKTLDVKDAKIMPFVEVTYEDGSIITEYAFDSDWDEFTNTQEFKEVYLMSNFLRTKEFSKIKFGIKVIPTGKSSANNKGALRLESISVYRVNRNILKNENLIINNDWVPYTIIYRHNGIGAAMFNMLWKEAGEDVFTAIPQDCIAISPDIRDMSNSPASMKECILVTAECSGDNDKVYKEILTSRFDRRIDIKENHRKLVYHTNISVTPEEKLYIENINFPNKDFTIRINREIPKYIDGESTKEFTPWKYVEELNNLDLSVLNDLGGSVGVLIEIIDENEYEKGDVVQYSVKSNVTGIVDVIPDRRFYIDPLTLNYSNKLTIEDEDGEFIDTYELEMSKIGLTELNIYTVEEGIMPNKEQFILEFDITIDTPDRGLFFVNIDKIVGNDNRKSMLSFLYTGEEKEDPKEPSYYLDTYAYKIEDANTNSLISNIDRGIDWYKYPYRPMYLFKNSLEFNDPLNIDTLKLYKNKPMRILIRKNKQSIILGVQDLTDETSKMKIVGSWLDPSWESTLGGICSFQFLNISHVKISNLKFNM